MSPATVTTLSDRLAEPFEPREVKFKPQMVKGNKALAIAYVDVRLIEDRLDTVLGVENWQDDYEVLNDGCVVCRLRVKFGDEWVTKTDVGNPSEQPDGGDRLKASFSDALKRAAVKLGVGRYLYRLPAQWVDYDPAKKQIVRPPQLPAFALPGSAARKQAERVAAQVPGVTTGDALPDPVEAWRDFLRDDPPLARLNAKLPELAQLSKAAKGEVWAAVTAHAAEVGWVFDQARKAFGVPSTETAAY